VWASDLEAVVGQVRGGVHRRGDHLLLAERVVVGERHGVAVTRLDALGELRRDLSRGVARLREVAGPRDAAVGEIDALEERGDHLAELDEHQVGVVADLRQRVRVHPDQHLLVRLTGREHAQVRTRPGRQQHPERVARLRGDRRAIEEVGVVRVLGEALGEQVEQGLEHPPVRLERPRGVRLVRLTGGAALDLGRRRQPPVPAGPVVVAHVAGRLLEVRGQAAPFDRLGEQLRGLLAREVHAAELRDRIVAELEEHPIEQLLGLVDLDALETRDRAGLERLGELVEEQAAEGLRCPRVAREQGALDDLGQVGQCEDRAVEVGEVRREPGSLLVRELLVGEPGPHARASRP
jgi:hypothetical protein